MEIVIGSILVSVDQLVMDTLLTPFSDMSVPKEISMSFRFFPRCLCILGMILSRKWPGIDVIMCNPCFDGKN